MNRKELAVKGSVVGIVSQIITLLSKFIVRTFVIRILGKDILGLDSVLIDTISMLSLAELGVTSAMLYRLYAPIVQKDRERVAEWMATYKLIYYLIAAVIAVLGIIISFALPYIIKGISVPWSTIYPAFYLQLAGAVSSYLLAYQRILLNADQKKHLCLLADLAMTVGCSIGKIVVVAAFASYELYLIMAIIQVVASNLLLFRYSAKNYRFSCRIRNAKRSDLRLILRDTKEVMANRLAGYVYNSTDNLIISVFMGTGIVGLLSNYKYISSALRSLVNSAMTTIQPLIGNYLNSDTTKADSYRTLKRYTFIRYVIAGATTIPFIAVATIFVEIWTGNPDYAMPLSIVILLALDYYIGCVYGPLGEYILAMGLFREGKFATLSGAVANIILSLVGVKLWGRNGVLLATVISQLIIWAGDAHIIIFRYYSDDRAFRWDYILTHIGYLAILGATTLAALCLEHCLSMGLWGRLVILVLFSEVVFLITVCVTLRKRDEYSYAKELVFRTIRRVRH